MNNLKNAAFAIIHRELPGRYNYLERYLRDAPRDVIEDFYRMVKNFEEEVDRHSRRQYQG